MADMRAEGHIRITLKRSPIGYRKDQRETARLLGLRRLNASVVREKTPVVCGMVQKIVHLVEVEEVD
jgi:large subunit ribosomal protein L30